MKKKSNKKVLKNTIECERCSESVRVEDVLIHLTADGSTEHLCRECFRKAVTVTTEEGMKLQAPRPTPEPVGEERDYTVRVCCRCHKVLPDRNMKIVRCVVRRNGELISDENVWYCQECYGAPLSVEQSKEITPPSMQEVITEPTLEEHLNNAAKGIFKQGVKYDDGKLQWHLVPWEAMEAVVRVLMYGAEKYAPDNWKKVPDAAARYRDAAMRHLTAVMKGEYKDPETGEPHWASVACCALFSLWLEENESPELKNDPEVTKILNEALTKSVGDDGFRDMLPESLDFHIMADTIRVYPHRNEYFLEGRKIGEERYGGDHRNPLMPGRDEVRIIRAKEDV